MAANKVPGVRAALCIDAETARGGAPLERCERYVYEPARYVPADSLGDSGRLDIHR